jgi:AcrR family transcriptional regulator
MARSEIVAAALRLIRSRGYEEFTMRALACDLGTSPMAL